MRILYNNRDITDEVDINIVDVTEDCGETPDSIEAVFNNPQNLWSDWKPTKDDTIEVVHENYKSGLMFIDEIEQNQSNVTIRALSIPVNAKTKKSKSWENITLVSFASEIANNFQFVIQFFGVTAFSYKRVDQIDQADFAFLKDRCTYEGFSMKVTNKKIVIYDDKTMENEKPVKIITEKDFVETPIFKNKSTDIYSGCTVKGTNCSGSFTDPAVNGSILNAALDVGSQAEAERFAKNILRSCNKKEYIGKIIISLDTNITAGNTLEIAGMGLSDGKYFVDNAKHSFAEMLSTFKIHKCLERY